MPISATDAPKPLPKHAKDIYVSAWNAAYSSTCKTRSDRDECASKIAWGAVKKKYKKEGETWVAKTVHVSRTGRVGTGKVTWIKSAVEGLIGGYLVKWGSSEEKDLMGEWFTEDTDFWLDRWAHRPLLYQHGLDYALKGSDAVVGTMDDYELDEIGLWIQGQLDLRHRYKQAIEELIDQKALNLSSGALPRFVERSSEGWIKTWPIVEATLTPTPAEYRLADVVLVKAAFEAIGEELEKEVSMDEKTIWQRFGEKLGFVTDEEEEVDSTKATPKEEEEDEEDDEKKPKKKPKGKDQEKEGKEEKKSTPLPEFVLDESAVKAISDQVVVSMSTALKSVLDGAIVPLQTELDGLKAWREEVSTRLDATEKTIHDKALEIVNSLPPIVKVRATEVVKATETTEGDSPPALIEPAGPEISKWAELFSGIVERGLAQGGDGPMQI